MSIHVLSSLRGHLSRHAFIVRCAGTRALLASDGPESIDSYFVLSVLVHDLREAVVVWGNRYDQKAWLRQLDQPVTREMEDAVLRTIARLDGTPFPSTVQLGLRWLGGRTPRPRWAHRDETVETVYCAEIVAITFEAMGLLPGGHRSSWFDPGRFWSGDDLGLTGGATLGTEIAVEIQARTPR